MVFHRIRPLIRIELIVVCQFWRVVLRRLSLPRVWLIGNSRKIPLAIVLELIQNFLRIWVHQFSPGFKQRMHNIVNETDLKSENVGLKGEVNAYLRFLDGYIVSIAHRTHFQSLLLLFVTLSPIFF